MPVSRALELLGRRSTLKAGQAWRSFLTLLKVSTTIDQKQSRTLYSENCREFLKDNVEHFCMDAGSVKTLWSIKVMSSCGPVAAEIAMHVRMCDAKAAIQQYDRHNSIGWLCQHFLQTTGEKNINIKELGNA